MIPIRAVLFDFAGTLLVPEPRDTWVAAVCPDLSPYEVSALAGRLDDAGRPGGPEPVALPQEWAEQYARRDVSLTDHREVYEGLLGAVTDPPTTRALYERATSPEGWVAYPDAHPVLAELRARGVAIGVVSNVGFDLPAVFAGHGLAPLVDTFVLSYQLGVMKPAAEMFSTACDRLAVGQEETLMVGDNFRADGGAVEDGVRTLLLPYSAAGADHGLDAVLMLVP